MGAGRPSSQSYGVLQDDAAGSEDGAASPFPPPVERHLLTRLSLARNSLADVCGLQLLPSLAVLDLSNNQLRDLQPLQVGPGTLVLRARSSCTHSRSPVTTVPLCWRDASRPSGAVCCPALHNNAGADWPAATGCV